MFFPALDIHDADADLVLAVVDDFTPSAVGDLAGGITVYFASSANRDAAGAAIASHFPGCRIARRDVDDEDWARRSQQGLSPVRVGRIVVTPPWSAQQRSLERAAPHTAASGESPAVDTVEIVIEPSMGFGTGHHATTRLCLAALQRIDLRGTRVVDVGTGSGVLAIAASRLGAREVDAIDSDMDAVQNARDNLLLNPSAAGVNVRVADLRTWHVPPADILVANLTGAVLAQNAVKLLSLVAHGGTLVVSGLLADERLAVVDAFRPAAVRHTTEEAGWLAMEFELPALTPV